MKKTLKLLAILSAAALFSTTAYAADVAKIGVINFEKIMNDSSAGKVSQKELKAKWTELQKKLNQEKQSVEEFSLAIERESLVLSPEKKRAKQRELEDRVNDLKRMNADFTEEFQILQNENINQIQKDVFEIVNEMGKKQGYLLIVERKVGGVLYAPAQVDITDEVIKLYNAQTASKKK